MTTSISTVEAKETFAELINHLIHSKERIILTRREKEVAAIIPIEDLRLLENMQDQADLHDAINALKETKEIGITTLEALKEEIGI